MIVVANAGPLIALAQIGQLHILPALYGQIHIPSAVRKEVLADGRERPGAVEIGAAPWIRIDHVRDRTAVQLLLDRLDAGESAAIVLALELKADLLLMDEARGRRIAEARGLSKTGTVGILIAAKQHGLLPAVTSLLDSLLAAGFRLSAELYRQARLLAGES